MCRERTNEMNIWFNVGCSFGSRSHLSLFLIGESRPKADPNTNPIRSYHLPSDACCDCYERQLNHLNIFLITVLWWAIRVSLLSLLELVPTIFVVNYLGRRLTKAQPQRPTSAR
jgi:hypothetical protein